MWRLLRYGQLIITWVILDDIIVIKFNKKAIVIIIYEQVILSDGDLSTLVNMKFNLEMNHLNVEAGMRQRNNDQNMVSLNLNRLSQDFAFIYRKCYPHTIW